ncbi:hypothetical protein EJ110_NYTH20265 [Nymphaea thermarum]|nr:hypothetical protein EJ110_NYTH20265 [Nymphaea thermarum]
MDHAWTGLRQGLTVLGDTSERRSSEECEIIVDPYAAEAICRYVPPHLRLELQRWATSYYTLDHHVEAILKYQGPKIPEPSHVAWNQTKQHTLTLFRRMSSIGSISYENFDAVKWVSSSAAGFGYGGRKGDDDNYARAKRTAVTIAEKLDYDREYAPQALLDSTPDIAFTRTQLSQIKAKSKIRNVWGEAFHYVLLEGLFADPLIEYFKEDLDDSFYSIGKGPLFSVPGLIEDILSEQDYVYMLDWSSFDASVQEWEIRFAFECLESILLFPSNVEMQIWRFVIELFIYRKIAGPNGVLYLKIQGIPAGSCFTNIVGSIVNYNRIQYMFKRLVDDFVIAYTQGDDSLVGVKSTQFIMMNMFEPIFLELGWKLNTAKSASGRKEWTNFLSRPVRELQNARDELTCLRMFKYPEYHMRYGDDADLPAKQWDPTEYEARRLSASELL